MDFINHFLEKARSGDVDAAFHDLAELGSAAIPALREAYRFEADPTTRAVIVRAIREHKLPLSVDFFAFALNDISPEVWKEALDGLVALATPEACQALVQSLTHLQDVERRVWFQEAIAQINSENDKQRPPFAG
jgi:HEAT repeat protein